MNKYRIEGCKIYKDGEVYLAIIEDEKRKEVCHQLNYADTCGKNWAKNALEYRQQMNNLKAFGCQHRIYSHCSGKWKYICKKSGSGKCQNETSNFYNCSVKI